MEKQQIGETLYNLDSKGKLRLWSIFVEDCTDHAKMIMVAGLDQGKKADNISIISAGKNDGKANATTYWTQALDEARAKYAKQLKRGYVADKTKVQQATTGSGISKPMLAEKYDPTGKQDKSKTLEQIGIVGKPIGLQIKFDGLRCMTRIRPPDAHMDIAEVTMFSRKGEIFRTIPHIEQQVRDSYNAIADGINTEIILDGELYTNIVSFNKLNGLLKKETLSEADLAILAQVKYHLYDVMLDQGYRERHAFLSSFKSEHVPIVETYIVDADAAVITAKLEEFLAEGHEGIMLRQLDMPYENRRTWQLCKGKVFEDKEFKIIKLELDARQGLGAFVCAMDIPDAIGADGKPVTEFRAGIKGVSREEGLNYLENKEKYLDKEATICFFGRSEYQVPRFAKFKGFV